MAISRSQHSTLTQHSAAPQVIQATDVGGNTVNLTAAMNFCGTQVYSTSGVLLPAASYGAVPGTYITGVPHVSAADAMPWSTARALRRRPAVQHHACARHRPDWHSPCVADVATLRTLAAATPTPAATPSATPSAGEGPHVLWKHAAPWAGKTHPCHCGEPRWAKHRVAPD